MEIATVIWGNPSLWTQILSLVLGVDHVCRKNTQARSGKRSGCLGSTGRNHWGSFHFDPCRADRVKASYPDISRRDGHRGICRSHRCWRNGTQRVAVFLVRGHWQPIGMRSHPGMVWS
jgi:hypothetical protein